MHVARCLSTTRRRTAAVPAALLRCRPGVYRRLHQTPHWRASRSGSVAAELRTDPDVTDAKPTVTFKELGVVESLVRALGAQGITTPTPVQAEGLPVTTASHCPRHCIVHSETGTGKTLVFLLPALQDQAPGLGTVILVPTRELAVQVHHQAASLAGHRRNSRRILSVFSGHGCAGEGSLDEVKPHILIGTPKRVLELVESNIKAFVDVRRIVLDEVDKIFLISASRETARRKAVRELHPRAGSVILTKLLSCCSNSRQRDVTPQLIATSATVSQKLQLELLDVGWGTNPVVISTSAHKLALPNSIKHEYVVCSQPKQAVLKPRQSELDGTTTINKSNDATKLKLNALTQHFKSSGERSALTFIHRGASVTDFVRELSSRGVKATALYSKMLDYREYPKFVADFESGRIEMAVGTEETVRGLDFLWLGSVYLMEVPRSAAEYLHLCGRVGRQGKSGRAVVLVEGATEEKRILRQYAALGVKGVCVNTFEESSLTSSH